MTLSPEFITLAKWEDKSDDADDTLVSETEGPGCG